MNNKIFQKIKRTLSFTLFQKFLKKKGINEQHIYKPPTLINFSQLINIAICYYFIQHTNLLQQVKQQLYGQEETEQKILKLNKKDNDIQFKDIIGIDQYKEEVMEIIDFFKNSETFKKYGAEIPKGVLLHGQPGTGKTMLAKALANESGVNFYYKSGSEFQGKYRGSGSNNIKNLFQRANKNKPSIIFIDEIDAIAKKRGQGVPSDAINQLLTEMDGFTKQNQVVVIGATNRLHQLDPALLRPSRFDKIIEIPVPNEKARSELIDYFLSKVKIDKINKKELLKRSKGFTGADIKNLINISALNAVNKKRQFIIDKDIDYALDRLILGNKKRNEDDKLDQLMQSYNQASVALLSYKLNNQMMSGISLDKNSDFKQVQQNIYNKKDLENQLNVMLGCQVSEQMFFMENDQTQNCLKQNKISQKIAERYVTSFSDKQIISQHLMQKPSEQIQYQKQQEIKQLIKKQKIKTKEILQQNISIVQEIANTLLLQTKLNKNEIIKIIERQLNY